MKNLQFWTKLMGKPLKKDPIWRLCKMEYLYSLGRLFLLNDHQTLFQGLFWPKTNKEEISIF